jgi:hypothetical protein
MDRGKLNVDIFAIVSIAIWLVIFIYWIIRSKDRGVLNELAGLIKLIFSGLILFVPVFLPFTFLVYKPLMVIKIVGLGIVAFGFAVCIVNQIKILINQNNNRQPNQAVENYEGYYEYRVSYLTMIFLSGCNPVNMAGEITVVLFLLPVSAVVFSGGIARCP